MISILTYDQFIVQVLSSLTGDSEIQMLHLRNQIRRKENPLTIEDVKQTLSFKAESITSEE
jgi:hypothetical protein